MTLQQRDIETQVRTELNQAASARERLQKELTALDEALRRAQQAANELPAEGSVVSFTVRRKQEGWRWPWKR